jgi:hypothetical protein
MSSTFGALSISLAPLRSFVKVLTQTLPQSWSFMVFTLPLLVSLGLQARSLAMRSLFSDPSPRLTCSVSVLSVDLD